MYKFKNAPWINTVYSVSQKNPPPPWGLVAIFPKRLGIFQPNFTCLLCIPIYARLQILFKYLQVWRNYAVLSVTTQIKSCAQNVHHQPKGGTRFGRWWTFTLWWSHLIWHNFVTVIPPHLTYVATLPCETWITEKSTKFTIFQKTSWCIFTVRRSLHGLSYRNSVRLSVCLSVRLSVTLVDCVHMVRPTIMISPPYGSPIILVSGDITFIP